MPDFARQLTEWRRVIALVPSGMRAEAFGRAAVGIAELVASRARPQPRRRGADRDGAGARPADAMVPRRWFIPSSRRSTSCKARKRNGQRPWSGAAAATAVRLCAAAVRRHPGARLAARQALRQALCRHDGGARRLRQELAAALQRDRDGIRRRADRAEPDRADQDRLLERRGSRDRGGRAPHRSIMPRAQGQDPARTACRQPVSGAEDIERRLALRHGRSVRQGHRQYRAGQAGDRVHRRQRHRLRHARPDGGVPQDPGERNRGDGNLRQGRHRADRHQDQRLHRAQPSHPQTIRRVRRRRDHRRRKPGRRRRSRPPRDRFGCSTA